MANSYDIIVIGGSVNGLVAAAYLARAGQRVLVLEQRGDIGGTFVTEDAFPGFRFNTVVHDVGWLSPRIVQDLELARHGLDLIRPDVTVLMPHTTTPSPTAMALRTTRAPKRSRARPMPSAPAAPTIVAQKFNDA